MPPATHIHALPEEPTATSVATVHCIMVRERKRDSNVLIESNMHPCSAVYHHVNHWKKKEERK
jgi:hypothetical protein